MTDKQKAFEVGKEVICHYGYEVGYACPYRVGSKCFAPFNCKYSGGHAK